MTHKVRGGGGGLRTLLFEVGPCKGLGKSLDLGLRVPQPFQNSSASPGFSTFRGVRVSGSGVGEGLGRI